MNPSPVWTRAHRPNEQNMALNGQNVDQTLIGPL